MENTRGAPGSLATQAVTTAIDIRPVGASRVPSGTMVPAEVRMKRERESRIAH